MPRAIDVRAEFEAHDWIRSHIWAKDGVLAGYVALRLHGRLVIRSWPCGLNNSAVSLVRSALADHAAASRHTALDADWPLFFWAGGLHNDCGVIADFSVRHKNGAAILSQFHHREVPRRARVVMSWTTWSRTVGSMKKEYDFSKARKNPYAKRLKRSVTIRVDERTVAYFKDLATESEIP